MKKITTLLVLCALTLAAYAVPARRGWQTRTQADGTTIEIQQIGDEFYHYTINRDGKRVREINGMYEVVGEAPTPAEFNAKRLAAKARRAPMGPRKVVGSTPNLAPKGVIILANFKDTKMQSAHTQAVFNELCNSASCTVNTYNGVNYPSAAQYFADQSNGAYRPQFDVFGPVTLSKNVSYYGTDTDPDDEGSDQYATDAVVEACLLANQNFDINFKDYDSDSDGYVDFVYVIYAGQGQADGGSAETIWPHNWEIESAISYNNCTYTKSQCVVDGKKLNNYAMSGELSGSSLGGIGTLCHEFGHVMGLPDWYDTEYGTNYKNYLTPNEWDIMDGGSYNGDGHCPPNYSPWEKYFFGWITPENLGSEGAKLELKANGVEGYKAYQVNASGKQQKATDTGVCYYFENRQKQGWDKFVPAAGLLIWKVNFDATSWENNEPNNTANNPRYTIVCSNGTKVGKTNGTGNVWPYGTKNSWTGVSGKPLKDITKSGQLITLTYIEEPAIVVDPFEITFMANGVEFTKTTSTGKIVLPATEPAACDGKVFMGWCSQANYSSATTAPAFVKAGQAITEPTTFYAVFAEQDGEGSTEISDELTLATTGASGTSYTDWSGKKVTSSAVYAGNSAGGNDAIQLRSKNSNSGIVSTTSGGKLTKVIVEWNSNTSDRTLDIYGKTTAYSAASDLYDNSGKGTKLGSMASGTDTELTISGDYTFVGVRSNNGALWIDKITFVWSGKGVSYKNYTTSCDGATPIDNVDAKPAAVKAIRNGRIVIIRDGAVFDLTGTRIE
ncbi:MAG: M6 family metalloprotease domain-containing protein [Paludibacteraceae bacterium]|nr:M6 family metalloprotease domain-containing protein [Paludibacteraceae bacterium]